MLNLTRTGVQFPPLPPSGEDMNICPECKKKKRCPTRHVDVENCTKFKRPFWSPTLFVRNKTRPAYKAIEKQNWLVKVLKHVPIVRVIIGVNEE